MHSAIKIIVPLSLLVLVNLFCNPRLEMFMKQRGIKWLEIPKPDIEQDTESQREKVLEDRQFIRLLKASKQSRDHSLVIKLILQGPLDSKNTL